MKMFKIHPATLCVACPNGVLTDKDATYPEDTWEQDRAKELVKMGYLVEVKVETEIKKPKK